MRYADAHCTYTEQLQPEHTYTFTGPCIVTGKPYSVAVKATELCDYRYLSNSPPSSPSMQHWCSRKWTFDAFKSLSMRDQDFLSSGISPEGFNELA